MADLTTAEKAPLIVESAGVDILNQFSVTNQAAIADAGVVGFGGLDGDQHLLIVGLTAGSQVIEVEGNGAYSGQTGSITVAVADAPLTLTLGPAVPK